MTNSDISLSICLAGVDIFSYMMDPRSKERATLQERESATSILKRFDSHKLLPSIGEIWWFIFSATDFSSVFVNSIISACLPGRPL